MLRRLAILILSWLLVAVITNMGLAADVEWKEKSTKISDKTEELVIELYGLFPSFEYKASSSDRIVVKYPKVVKGKAYRVDFKERGDTLEIWAVPEGYKPGEPDDEGLVFINALRMLLDMMEMVKKDEYYYIIIELPERFKDHVGSKFLF